MNETPSSAPQIIMPALLSRLANLLVQTTPCLPNTVFPHPDALITTSTPFTEKIFPHGFHVHVPTAVDYLPLTPKSAPSIWSPNWSLPNSALVPKNEVAGQSFKDILVLTATVRNLKTTQFSFIRASNATQRTSLATMTTVTSDGLHTFPVKPTPDE